MAHQTFFKSDMAPRVQARAAKRKEAEAQRRMVYRLVDERDQRRCRACGRRCRQTLELVPDRLEHHHIRPRSLGGTHETGTLMTACLACHCEITGHRLSVSGDADQQLTFQRGTTTWHG